MQQQQGPRDRIAQMQQMAGSSEFQPPRRRAPVDGPEQMGDGQAGDRESGRASSGADAGPGASRDAGGSSRPREQP